jgi:hypothetical protein
MISHHASQTLYESIPSMFLAPKGEPEKQEIKIVNTKEANRSTKRFDNECGVIW